MNKIKKIGIVGWSTGENSFGVTKPYLHYLSQFGEVEILMPSRHIRRDLDLLVLPGGMDINPFSYRQVPGYYTSNTDVHKQYFYDVNLQQYVEIGVPIFGICLGFQQLCAYYGFGLDQHRNYPYSSPRSELVEEVHFMDKTFGVVDKVNSMHHQGIDANSMTSSALIAFSKKSNNVEIAKFDDHIMGVQYHPEETFCPVASNLIRHLLKLPLVLPEKAPEQKEVSPL